MKKQKERFSLMIIKTLLSILLFTGMGVIIIGGAYIIGEYHRNKITKPVVWETENSTKEKFRIESMWKTKISKDSKITSQFQKSIEINILDDDYSIVDDEYSEFQFIKIVGFGKYMHDEKLVLPQKRVEIDIPLSATVNSISISGFDPINLGAVNIPLFNAVSKFSEESIYLDFSTLSNYVDPIDNPIWFQRKNAIFKTVYLDVIPVVFNVETKNATLYKNLTIRLDYETEQNGILIDASTLKYSYSVDENISAYVTVENTVAETALFKIYWKIETVMGGELMNIDNSFNINSGEAVKINIDFDDNLDIPGEYFFEAEVYDITGKIGKIERQFTVFSDQLDASDLLKVSDISNWQAYRNEEFGFEIKYPEYYSEDRYDLENMTDLDYERIYFFRDMSNDALNDFKKHYITSLHEGGTHSGTIDIKSYNENELKAWYAIDSFNDLKLKEYGNFKVYILEIGEVGSYYIIPHNSVDNLYFVFNIPASLQNDFENNWLSTFKFTNQNTNIVDVIKENKKIEYLADFKFKNLPNYVYQEQKGETYKLENYIFQFIRQPNLNIFLSISNSDIKYKGVLCSKDNGSSWNNLFIINNPIDYNGDEVKYNPVGMFVKNDKLYLDISDDRGAGSGEGNLLRYYTENGETWTRDSCLYLIPELYFTNKMNGNDGIDPFSSVANCNCIYSPVSLCDDEPFGTGIGSDVYPIDPKYKDLHFLGQLFTAANCGKERLNQIWGVSGENYILGSAIWLIDDPSSSLIDTLRSIGYECSDKSSDDSCKKWELEKTVKISDLLKLEPYYKNFKQDDCRNCG